jgi:predicted choloylglycine hydrolase
MVFESSKAMPQIDLTFHAIEELQPGERWQALFEATWSSYRRWFLRAGDDARPPYADAVRMLRTHMPELIGTYEQLVDLAGGGDLAARMLALYDPPPYLSGCSQGVLREPSPLLVRNYDYAPDRLEGVMLHTAWAGRRVIGMSDCLWGLLDGVNDAGLAVSLTFGGRRVLGHGFGIPLVVRYLLETCASVSEASAVLARLPYQLAHTLTLADATGDVVTAYLSPDRGAIFRDTPVATNHQGKVEWTEHGIMTHTVKREECISRMVSDPEMTREAFVESFLRPPLYNTTYSRGFGTLYTAAYCPVGGQAEYLWPGKVWKQSFAHFTEGTHVEVLNEQAVA